METSRHERNNNNCFILVCSRDRRRNKFQPQGNRKKMENNDTKNQRKGSESNVHMSSKGNINVATDDHEASWQEHYLL